MRIIRFIAADGRVVWGEDRGDGTATVLGDLEAALHQPAAEPAAGRCDLRGKHALVADDDENMRRIMRTVLEKAGCRCHVCADGAEAMAAIEHEPIDLVVTDIVMPHHDGYELFTAARRRDDTMPVLLVTGFGYDPTHTLVRAAREGHESVLYKPFTPDQLLDEVDKAVRSCNGALRPALTPTAEHVGIARVLAPLRPTNIVCVGRNYGHPGGDAGPDARPETLEVFLKPTTCIQAPRAPIRLPAFDGVDPRVECEGELAVVLGSTARDVPEPEALDCVLGYTIANDVTARSFQTDGGPPRWMRGKGFDTFCPLGPAIVTPDEAGEIDDLPIVTRINGREVQRGSTRGMVRPVRSIVSALSRHVTLPPGTVILTGSPPPTAPAALAAGDEVTIEIGSLGRLANPVEAHG